MKGQAVELVDLFSKCSELAAQEQEGMVKIVSTMLPILEWLDEPVVLRTESLEARFRGFTSVTLGKGAKVEMTDSKGEVSSRHLREFKAAECLAVLDQAFPELQRMVASKRRDEQVKPLLLLRMSSGGSKVPVGKRSYWLEVSNDGGDCTGLTVHALLPGGKTAWSRPFDLLHGKKMEADLSAFKEVSGIDRLDIEIECKDAEGCEFRAEASVPVGGADWKDAQLKKKDKAPAIVSRVAARPLS